MELFKDDYLSIRKGCYYPKGFWNRVIQTVMVKVDNRTFWGFFNEQPERCIENTDLLEGRISHVITRLFMVQNILYGNVGILDTTAGKLLLKAVVNDETLVAFPRAYGGYLQNSTHEGKPIINVNTYILEAFDIFIER